MGRFIISATALVAVCTAAPASARPLPAKSASVADNIAFSNNMCASAVVKDQVSADFADAVRLRFLELKLRMRSDTRIVVPVAHASSVQGFPNGFALENGRIKGVACNGNVAMRINGKIVEYRGLSYWVKLEPSKPPYIMTLDPSYVAAFVDHLYIDGHSLVPGNDDPNPITAADAKSFELNDMISAGIHGPFTPEMIMQWRLRRLSQLLGPLSEQGLPE